MKSPFALLLVAATTLSHACLWDSDTLRSERARFPGIAELIGGRFARHSKEFYQWRLDKVKAQIAKGAKAPGLYDDLAVSQHKLGDHQAAIETMLAKEKLSPGIYETYSNLGTFYIYTGQLEQALTYINRALKINPNAHFGREQYQQWLVEWVSEGKPQSSKLKPNPAGDPEFSDPNRGFSGFAAFIAAKSNYAGHAQDWKQGRVAALSGVGGMMRFADFDNPILLEALGDVLNVGNMEENASLLACQAYLLASQRSKTDAEVQRLWGKMIVSGGTKRGFDPETVKNDLRASLAGGENYAAKVWTDEREWIAKGADVQAEFEKKYLPSAK